tara:strand:+ start:1609 stop:2220 length:612 start_codon:yes stop_codon:yes gene_type:complete
MATKHFLFQRFTGEGVDHKVTPGDTKGAQKWFKTQVGKIKDINTAYLMRSKGAKDNSVKRIFEPGDMFLFAYDPKTKEQMPYYDRYPLVVVLDVTKTGFLGLNMHYLPPLQRSILMSMLYQTLNNTEFDETTRIMARYKQLKAMSGHPYYKPCVKRYLNNKLTSSLINIHPAEWDMVVMLPLERFFKQHKSVVWQDSRKMYNK